MGMSLDQSRNQRLSLERHPTDGYSIEVSGGGAREADAAGFDKDDGLPDRRPAGAVEQLRSLEQEGLTLG
jgi:hypothetical protein